MNLQISIEILHIISLKLKKECDLIEIIQSNLFYRFKLIHAELQISQQECKNCCTKIQVTAH